MSLLQKIFGSAPMNTATPPAPPQVGNDLNKNPPPQGTQQSAQTAPNGVVPAGGNEGPKTTEPPLAEFKDLWEPPKTDPNAPNGNASELTPEKMMEAASKVDFTRLIPQESLAKITAGGAEAAQALAEIVNKVAQGAYGQSAVVAQKMVEKAVAQEREALQNSLPTMMKRHTLNDPGNNPALQNPAVAPILQAIQTQLVEKYPTRSTSEIEDMAKKVLVGAAELVVPPQKTPGTETQDDGTDWEQWIKQG